MNSINKILNNKLANPNPQQQSIPSFIGQAATEFITDPPKDAIKDTISGASVALAGDRQGAIGKGMSAIGNGLLSASMFIPGANFLGKGVRHGSRALGIASKFLGKPGVANKVIRFGETAAKYLQAPKNFVTNKAPLVGKLIGNQKIINPGTTSKGPLAAIGRGAVNIGVPSAASLGNIFGGELTYASSPSGKMESMTNSSIFEDIVGKDMVNEISGLSAKDKLKVYDYLKDTDIPSRVLGDWSSK